MAFNPTYKIAELLFSENNGNSNHIPPYNTASFPVLSLSLPLTTGSSVLLNSTFYPAVSSISAVSSPVGGSMTRLDNRSAISKSLPGV